MPINVLRTGMHPHMMLYMLDKLFCIYRGVGMNDVDGQHIVAYQNLTIALLHCMKQCISPKKACSTLEDAYSWVVLSDVNGLECLAWAVYDGVFMPGDPLVLTSHPEWACIITGTTIHLIFHGATNS